jgi:hypothetical protein
MGFFSRLLQIGPGSSGASVKKYCDIYNDYRRNGETNEISINLMIDDLRALSIINLSSNEIRNIITSSDECISKVCFLIHYYRSKQIRRTLIKLYPDMDKMDSIFESIYDSVVENSVESPQLSKHKFNEWCYFKLSDLPDFNIQF